MESELSSCLDLMKDEFYNHLLKSVEDMKKEEKERFIKTLLTQLDKKSIETVLRDTFKPHEIIEHYFKCAICGKLFYRLDAKITTERTTRADGWRQSKMCCEACIITCGVCGDICTKYSFGDHRYFYHR